MIARGSCWGHAVGDEPIRLNEGDLIVFPQGDAHVLSSAAGMRAEPDMSAFARTSTPLPYAYEFGGGGEDRTRIVCAFMGCDERPIRCSSRCRAFDFDHVGGDPRAPDGWARF